MQQRFYLEKKIKIKAEAPLEFSLIYACMSEDFNVSFQKATRAWIDKGIFLYKMILFKTSRVENPTMYRVKC